MRLAALVVTFAASVSAGNHRSFVNSFSDGVKNLTASQEGFDGLFSLTWTPPKSVPRSYGIAVTDINAKPVEFKSWLDPARNIASVKVNAATNGTSYHFAVTPIGAAGLDGPSTSTIVTYRTNDPDIIKYVSVLYGGQYANYELAREFHNVTVPSNSKLWFFSRACVLPDELTCSHIVTTDRSALVPDLREGENYNMRVVLHVRRLKARSLRASSNPIADVVDNLPWGGPENVNAKPDVGGASLDEIRYIVTWTLPPRTKFDSVTASAFIDANQNSRAVATNSTRGVDPELSVSLDYVTRYTIRCDIVYDLRFLGIDRTKLVHGGHVQVTTPAGRSYPVRRFTATQDGYSCLVTLTWLPPKKTNGPVTRYRIKIVTVNGTDTQIVDHVKSTATNVVVAIENAKFHTLYKFSIIAINDESKGSPIIGEAAFTYIILQEGNGHLVWIIVTTVAVIIIVTVVCCLIVKRRRGLCAS